MDYLYVVQHINTNQEVVEYKSSAPEFMPTLSNDFQMRKHCGMTVVILHSKFLAFNN